MENGRDPTRVMAAGPKSLENGGPRSHVNGEGTGREGGGGGGGGGGGESRGAGVREVAGGGRKGGQIGGGEGRGGAVVGEEGRVRRGEGGGGDLTKGRSLQAEGGGARLGGGKRGGGGGGGGGKEKGGEGGGGVGGGKAGGKEERGGREAGGGGGGGGGRGTPVMKKEASRSPLPLTGRSETSGKGNETSAGSGNPQEVAAKSRTENGHLVNGQAGEQMVNGERQQVVGPAAGQVPEEEAVEDPAQELRRLREENKQLKAALAEAAQVNVQWRHYHDERQGYVHRLLTTIQELQHVRQGEGGETNNNNNGPG
ncbi:uncharacterized protein LOC143035209, partial [Oratosquilla oratoria]|uniref:uncharacterized protein LOC143035209 n=1 Tax=Oratosquilla oratoria TaxID=337810 RepID=UPI003F763682